ncbi:hypothetical protein F7D59_02045 [Prevotella copri]|uniref:Uncharacterized protein n=1 Tax=Segatella copri TaxID=165179 RepID=A0AA90ZWQ3_9BACT|nr:hypothetical protein [Segatella copri]
MLVFFNVFRLYSRSNYQQRLIIRHLFIEAYRPFNTPHSTFNNQHSTFNIQHSPFSNFFRNFSLKSLAGLKIKS